MPQTFFESNIQWTFDNGWTVTQYDNTTWYKNQFKGCCDSKAVDFIAFDTQCSMLWLIEVKDFTSQQPEESKDLATIIPKKVRDTLAGILAGAIQANDPAEKNFFRAAIKAPTLRVAFHCEGPRHKSRLFNRFPDPGPATKLQEEPEGPRM
jgi:hypothetical protein